VILVDTAEPANIVKLLRQAVPVTVSPLNQNKIADYFFGNYEGKRLQFGRVQAGELIGDIDSMEDELRRYYNSTDETNQIIEGLISPVRLYMKEGSAPVSDHSYLVNTRDLGAKIFCYPVMPSGFIEHGHSFTTTQMAELYAWIYRLDQVGVSTYYTNNWEETARFLVTVFRNEQKPPEEHTTFKRVYRPRVQIKEADSFLKSLLFLSSAYKLGIGDVKAQALADKFVNILDLAMASIEEVASCEKIGNKKAKEILKALGREI
jgi:hypothetical protein